MVFDRRWQRRASRRIRHAAGRTSLRRRGSRRGVSDVIATILLLALTVVLFSSIFAFVTSFPAPPAQNVTQFSASEVLTSNNSYISQIHITHLAGPAVSGSSLVYFKSARFPGAPEFQNPILVSAGLGGAVTWNLGQVFNYTFSTSPFQLPVAFDNITVLVVSSSQLIFSTVLPGQIIHVPPTFVSTGVLPSSPGVGQAFTVYATVTGSLGGKSVYVNLANIPGLSGTYPTAQVMTFNAGTGQWTFSVPAGLTAANGTYFAFVNVTTALGDSAVAGIAIPFTSGTSASSVLSVAVGLTSVPMQGSTTTFAAYVTYTGSETSVPLNVTFFANRSVGTTGAYAGFTGHGPSTGTISGPSTVTVFSTTAWPVPRLPGSQTFVITAVASLAGIGSAVGSYVYTLPLGLGPGALSVAPSHSCTLATNCPTVSTKLYLNGTSFFGTGPFTISASIYVNYTSNNSTAKSWSTGAASITVAPAKLSANSFLTLTSKTQWKPAVAGLQVYINIVVTVTGVGFVQSLWLGPTITTT